MSGNSSLAPVQCLKEKEIGQRGEVRFLREDVSRFYSYHMLTLPQASALREGLLGGTSTSSD